jgi:hypothetical protein
MKERIRTSDIISCDVFKPNARMLEKIPKAPTHWWWEQWKKMGRSGAYVLDSVWEADNVCTDEGVTHMLDVTFSGGTQKTVWYLLLFNTDYTPLITNTYQAPGFTESTNYDEGARPTWQEAGVVNKALTNSANRAYFTMNATETIYGGALVSANTKGDVVSGEVMYSSSKFSASKSVDAEDVLKVTLGLSAADS